MADSTKNDEKIFSFVADKLENELAPFGFRSEKTQKNGVISKIFVSEEIEYEISFNISTKIFFLKSGELESFDSKKIVSSWLFDQDEKTNKQLEVISSDFLASIGILDPKKNKKKSLKHFKKNKNNDDSEIDPIFLINRIASVFPDLKKEIQKEKDSFERFRPVTFTMQNIVPKIKETLVCSLKEKNEIKKLSKIFNSLYKTGDLDTRSIITMVILNSIKDEEDKFKEYFEDDLKKAWTAAKKIKGKKISPEKTKKIYKYFANKINSD
ncbi:MAG: hypothetical protein LBT82_00680 [Oscillospiraceae bacterium]|nr:hypothetical protein [Oscillospiraceae bacterium]